MKKHFRSSFVDPVVSKDHPGQNDRGKPGIVGATRRVAQNWVQRAATLLKKEADGKGRRFRPPVRGFL